MDRTILHLDLDAFYASVEQLDDPQLRGRPVLVGGNRTRGVVSAASYEARAYGVHSAMPMARAARLCPQAVVRPVRMARYRELSQRVFAVYHDFTDRIEPLSIDEAFLDVTASRRLFGSGERMARLIREQVRERTGLTVSVGIAASKFIAKMASDRAKPDGIYAVPPECVADFLRPLDIEQLWGIGGAGAERLKRHGIMRVGDVLSVDRLRLKSILGDKLGEKIWHLARGIDEREVEAGDKEQSIGAEKTYSGDLFRREDVEKALLALCEEVGRRVRAGALRGRCSTLKVRYADFTTVSRSQTHRPGLNTTDGIYDSARQLLRRTDAGRRPVRLLGVTLSQLEGRQDGQAELFEDQGRKRQEQLDGAVDELRRRFGAEGVVRGSLLGDDSKK